MNDPKYNATPKLNIWQEWKDKKEAEFRDAFGYPLPVVARQVLMNYGRTNGKTCGECAKLVYVKLNVSRCTDEGKDWSGAYPACGHFEQKQSGSTDKA